MSFAICSAIFVNSTLIVDIFSSELFVLRVELRRFLLELPSLLEGVLEGVLDDVLEGALEGVLEGVLEAALDDVLFRIS